MREERLVFEHPLDVRVKANECLVERLEIVMPEGDVRTLDIPGDLGEPFDESTFAGRREAALRRLAASLQEDGDGEWLPGVLSRSYALWTYKGDGAGERGDENR